jgi:hypothetical protein
MFIVNAQLYSAVKKVKIKLITGHKGPEVE